MNNPQNREETIFEAALQLPPEQRAAHLKQACGDDAQLRQRVERLLKSHEEASKDFLEQPPQALGPNKTIVVASPPIAEEQLGTMIGRYKLLEKIGEGGFGVVYVAEQREPVKRRVALKIIKLGMDTKQVVARFEVERQALAMMDHPNIAKVFDAGATETGRPYFVMELVRGIKITDYCDQNNLSTRERLELFAKVCQAIQHAHQKGIIHRDIKPSNILVTLHDGVPVPKVIDFGIAKATQGELTQKTVYTQLQQFIGTPAYMSPEQAEMSGLDIDTRSDIYALGVLLYELLTGKTPFDQKDLLSAGLDGMRRMIREQEPLRPSTRVSSLQGEERTTTAKRHGLDAPKLVHLLRGDLDWIVMKCLEKDRTRRYETANGVAMDLKRYLSQEPVVARPPSAIYRFQKFARRNKLAFAAGSAVAIALCLGVVASTWQAVRATHERRIADHEREHAQTEAKRADANAGAEARQRQIAEQATHRTQQALSASLEVEGDRLAQENNSSKALAYFARALRIDPDNRVAAQRIVSLLNQRDFPLPMLARPAELTFDPLRVMAYSADLRRFCVVTNETTLAVCDGRDGHLIGKPLPVEDRLTGTNWFFHTGIREADAQTNGRIFILFDGDGSRLAVGLTNKTTFWECATGLKLGELSGKLDAFSPDGKFAVLGDRVVDVASGREFFTIASDGPRSRAVFSPDGQMLAFVTDSNSLIEVLFTTNGQPVSPTIPTTIIGALPFVRFSPEGRRLIDSGSHGYLRVWDLVEQRQSFAALVHGNSVWAMDCSADGRLLATGARSGRAYLWSLVDGREARESCQSLESISTVCLARDGSWLGAQSFPTALGNRRLEAWWDTRTGRAVPIKLFHPAGVKRADYAPDGSIVLTLCADGAARIWRAQDGVQIGQPILYGKRVTVAIFNSDSTALATGSEDGEIRLWDAKSGQELKSLGRHETGVTALAFSPDGRYLASGADAASLKLWEIASGKLLAEKHIENGPDPDGERVMYLAFQPTGAHLVACYYYNHHADILELPTLRQLASLTKNQGGVFHASFSPDGKWLVTSSGGDAAQLWNAITGEGPEARYQHESGVFTSEFSSDGRLIVTASYDSTARVWDGETGRPVTEPLVHRGMVYHAVFHPDNRSVLTASQDGSAVVWDVQTGRALSEKFIHEGGVYDACFSPDGRHILSAGRDGLAEIHDWIEMPGDAPAWLPELAEAVGGFRLNENNVAEFVSDAAQTVARLRATLTNAAATDAIAFWGQWYLSDRQTRTVSPFAALSMREYSERLAEMPDLPALEEALALGSHKLVVYQKLAGLVAATQPETAQLYRRLAGDLSGAPPVSVATAASTSPASPTANASATQVKTGSAADTVPFFDPLDGAEMLKQDGQVIKIRGRIVQFGSAASGRAYYLNFSDNYRASLSLVFFPAENPAELRPELLRGFVNKTVVVEGRVSTFRGAPQIVLKSLADLKIVEDTEPAGENK